MNKLTIDEGRDILKEYDHDHVEKIELNRFFAWRG